MRAGNHRPNVDDEHSSIKVPCLVYFGEDDTVITKPELRTIVGIKDNKPDALACYCFGVSNSDAQQYTAIRDFIIKQTKAGMCSCDVSNPSGHCTSTTA